MPGLKHCVKCEHDWESKKDEPVSCPRCKSTYWRGHIPGKTSQFAEGFGHGKSVIAMATGGVKDANDRGAGSIEADVSERVGDGTSVPVLPKAKSKAKRLREVQSLRGELAGRGGSGKKPEGGAVGKVLTECPIDPKHRFFKNGLGYWCSDCGQAYQVSADGKTVAVGA